MLRRASRFKIGDLVRVNVGNGYIEMCDEYDSCEGDIMIIVSNPDVQCYVSCLYKLDLVHIHCDDLEHVK